MAESFILLGREALGLAKTLLGHLWGSCVTKI